MAGAGKKTFTAGEVLTASDVNTYLMEQSVMVFGGTAARSSAIPTPSEGMTTYRTDTNQIESYDGSAWRGMSGLQLVKTQTIGTGVSSVTVTNAFSATYDNYKIVVSGGTASTSTYFILKFGSTTTGYYANRFALDYTANTSGPLAINNGGDFTYAGYTTATGGHALSFDVMQPFATKYTQINGGFSATTATFGAIYNGYIANTISYTDFTVAMLSGNMTGGTIAVYGYAK